MPGFHKPDQQILFTFGEHYDSERYLGLCYLGLRNCVFSSQHPLSIITNIVDKKDRHNIPTCMLVMGLLSIVSYRSKMFISKFSIWLLTTNVNKCIFFATSVNQSL